MTMRDNRTTVTVRLTQRELSILYAFDGTPLSSVINKVRDSIKAEKLEKQANT
jgi:hypothetical protein